MAQDNSSSSQPKPEQSKPEANASPAKPKKRLWRLLILAAAALLILLIVLILFIPTIASTGMVRGIVVGKINAQMADGRVEIADWSIGWTGIDVKGVQVFDAKGQPLGEVSELKSSIRPLALLGGNVDLTITQLALQAKDDALKLQVDPQTPIHVTMSSDKTLVIDGTVRLPISYNVAKLWAIVKPMMVTSDKDALATAKFTGAFTRTFSVKGSFAAGKPFNEAIKSLEAWGDLQLGESYAEGFTLATPSQPAGIPFTLKDGHLRLVYHDKPEGQNEPAPIACNNGTLSLAGIYNVDLTDPNMATTLEKPGDLLVNISMNPALAQYGLADFLNVPTFSGAKDAKGLLSLKVLKMQSFPLSPAMMNPPAGMHYTLNVQYSITGLVIGSDMIDQVVSMVSKSGSSISTEIKDGTVSLIDGMVNEDSTLAINQKPLRIAGNVKLADRTFAPMTIYFPIALFGAKVPSSLAGILPAAVPIDLEGSMAKPQFHPENALPKLLENTGGKGLLNGLLGGHK